MLLEIGQGLFLNPDYIYKIEKGYKNVREGYSLYTIIIYVASNKIETYQGNVYRSEEILSFDSSEKRDDYFMFLFDMINNSSKQNSI